MPAGRAVIKRNACILFPILWVPDTLGFQYVLVGRAGHYMKYTLSFQYIGFKKYWASDVDDHPPGMKNVYPDESMNSYENQ